MKKNKRKVIFLLAVIIGLTFTVNFIAGNASVKAANAWSKTTHQTATDCAFNALNNDNKSAVNSFYTSKILSYRLVNGDIFGGTVNGNAKNALAEISQYPDIDEKGSHGYNITSYQRGGYYRGENDVPIYISSRTKLEEHYSMALSSYKSGYADAAIRHLGYAIHYIQDTANTNHAIVTYGASHDALEDYANSDIYYDAGIKHWQRFIPSSAGGYYGIFRKGFGDAINSLAETAVNSVFTYNSTTMTFKTAVTGYYTQPGTGYYGSAVIETKPYLDKVLERMVPVVTGYVAALLEQFYYDCYSWDHRNDANPTSLTENMDAAIQNGQVYFFKNNLTSSYLDLKGPSTDVHTDVHQWTFNGNRSQMFYARLHPLTPGSDANNTSLGYTGCFYFEPVYCVDAGLTDRRLEINTSAIIDNLRIGSKNFNSTYDLNQRFRISYLQNERYRITTGAGSYSKGGTTARYAKVLKIKAGSGSWNNGEICDQAADYYPELAEHYWTLEQLVDYKITTTGSKVFQQEFKSNKIYRYSFDSAVTSNVAATFIATNSSKNIFEHFTNTSGTLARVGNSATATNSYGGVTLDRTKIHYIKVFNIPQESNWHQPNWESKVSNHGTITTNNESETRPAWGAFDGYMGYQSSGSSPGQWTTNGTTRNAWLELNLDYEIIVRRIDFIQRTFSNEPTSVITCTYSGDNGIYLGGFQTQTFSLNRSSVYVDNVVTKKIRVNLSSIDLVYLGAGEIIITADRYNPNMDLISSSIISSSTTSLKTTQSWARPNWTGSNVTASTTSSGTKKYSNTNGSVEASSESSTRPSYSAFDGISGSSIGSSGGQWTTNGTTKNAWIELKLSYYIRISKITFTQRSYSGDPAANLEFYFTGTSGVPLGEKGTSAMSTLKKHTIPVDYIVTDTIRLQINVTTANATYLGANEIVIEGERLSDNYNNFIYSQNEKFIRLVPTALKLYTFKSVNYVEIYNSGGALIEWTNPDDFGAKKTFAKYLNTNQTYYVKYIGSKIGTSYFFDIDIAVS